MSGELGHAFSRMVWYDYLQTGRVYLTVNLLSLHNIINLNPIIVKQLSLVLNAVLLIAVAFLYYKVYSGSQPVAAPAISGSGMPANGIVYINSDSLLKGYNYFNELKETFDKRQDSIENFLTTNARSLEKEVQNYQNRAAGMSPEARAAEEEKLMGKQQNLLQLKESLIDQLQEQESVMNDSVYYHLSGYLKEFNKSRNHLFIMRYERGSGVLFANDSLDITQEVLKGLNSGKE